MTIRPSHMQYSIIFCITGGDIIWYGIARLLEQDGVAAIHRDARQQVLRLQRRPLRGPHQFEGGLQQDARNTQSSQDTQNTRYLVARCAEYTQYFIAGHAECATSCGKICAHASRYNARRRALRLIRVHFASPGGSARDATNGPRDARARDKANATKKIKPAIKRKTRDKRLARDKR